MSNPYERAAVTSAWFGAYRKALDLEHIAWAGEDGARRAFLEGRIDVDEFERRIEIVLKSR